ncbi:hypothetical protein F4825DRAFT_469435 [Nemania diffusa]|nr:hypothetical protein F4825DRAFT_469435 [Nemania diffusa]
MAPSAVNMNLNEQRSITGARNDTRNENEPTEWQKEILDEINGLGKSSSTESIESWIKACRDQHLKLDIDRLARFAVCKDALEVVEYLVDHEQASLAHRDTYGRSAIFYTLGSFPDHSMLKYVASQIPAESKLQDINHQDSINKRTPLHYAAERGDLDTIKSLLEIGAHTSIADRENKKPINIAHDQHQQRPNGESSDIMLLLQFCHFLSV